MPEQTQEQTQQAPILGSQYMTAGPADAAEIGPLFQNPQAIHPWDGDQAFIDLVHATIPSCPGSVSGDFAFFSWLYAFYGQAQKTTPKPAPTITALNPATAPANADVMVEITGTGFDSGVTVNIGSAHSITPTSVSPTDLVVLFGAVNIELAGTLQVTVTNLDSQISNEIDFVVT
jgi:hypothetical protein